MNELQVKYLKPLEFSQIDFNSSEIKAELETNLEKFQNLVVTEDAIKEAKDTRADLNKFRTTIENERKRVKNLCLEPYNAYELKIKELVGLVDKPILAIDNQVRTFEQKQKDDKKIEIVNFYNEVVGNLKNIIQFDYIFQDKWLNTATTMKSIKESITKELLRIENDLRIIDGFKSEFVLEIKDTYFISFDLTQALSKKQRLEELKADKLQREIELAKVEVQPVEEVETVFVKEVVEKVQNVIGACEPTKEISFKIKTTLTKLELLNDFLIENGIEFEQIREAQCV